MKKISVELLDEEDKIRLTFDSDQRFETMEGDVTRSHVSCKRPQPNTYNVLIDKQLFSKNSFNFKLVEKQNFNHLVFEYSKLNNAFSLRFEKNRDYSKQKLKSENVIYDIGYNTIVKLTFVDLLDVLDKKGKLSNTCMLLALDNDENKTLEFYYSTLKKFEKLGDKIKDVRKYLRWMIENFPITAEGIINKIVNDLREYNFLEIEQCIVDLEELDKKPIYFSPFLGKKDTEDPQYYVQKIEDCRRGSTSEFSKKDELKVQKLGNIETKKIPGKVRRVKRLLIVQKKYSPKQRIVIQNKIKQIVKYETNIVNPIYKNRRADLLGKLLNLLNSVLGLLTGISTDTITKALNSVITAKTLVEIPMELKELKKEEEKKAKCEQMRHISSPYKRETVTSETIETKVIKGRAVSAMKRQIRGPKTLRIVERLINLRGCSVTYAYIAQGVGGISTGWVREVTKRLNGVVLTIDYYPTHEVYIKKISDREFWVRIYEKFR